MSHLNSNSGGLSGCSVLPSAGDEEMEAYDSLPPKARRAMSNARVDLSAVATLAIYCSLGCTEESLVKLIEASDEMLVKQLENNR